MLPGLSDDERAILGLIVFELRSRKRLTQEQIADLAGVSRKYVSDLERGARRASFDGIVLLTRALDTTLVDFAAEYERRVAALKVTP